MHRVKRFSIVNEAEVDYFLELSCFFYDPADVGTMISGSSSFSKSSVYIWKFSVHVHLKPSLKILSITLLAYEMSAVVWNFKLSLALSIFGIEIKTTWPFPVLWNSIAEFSKFAGILSAAL